MLPLISVIVPIYNVEKNLPRCLNSILEQTYQNLEIILVDDGSSDHSPQICDSYAQRDSRIKVIHQKNSGPSLARNAGINAANGTFLTFVDSDDYIASNMCEFLYDLILENQADISICGRFFAFENGDLEAKDMKNVQLVMDSEKAIRNMCTFRYYDTASWCKLYKKSLFNSIRFPAGKICEDWYTIYKIFDKANKIVYDSTPLYYYYQRENSISRSRNITNASIDASRELLTFVKMKYPKIIDEVASAFAFTNIGVYNSYIKYNQKCNSVRRKQFQCNVRSYLSNIIKSRDFSKFRKIQATVFCCNLILYKFIFRLLKYKIRKRYHSEA